MKTILVTTDLSDESKNAFQTASTLAKAAGAKILLLAVIEDPAQAAVVYALDYPVLPDPNIRTQLVAKVKDDLSSLAKQHFTNVPCETFVAEATGSVPSEIINFARKNQADLIVISTHGRAGLSRLIIGSVAERVVRESTCPVLTVPMKR